MLLIPFSLVRTPDDYSCLFYFQKFHQFFFRISRVLFGLFRCLCDENIVLDASCHLGVVAMSRGVELRGVVVTNIRSSSGILKMADIENLSYTASGKITPTSPSTGEVVREYSHSLYSGCVSKVRGKRFPEITGYVLKDGYSWM